MLLEYSIYLVRAVVSAMVAVFLIFVRQDSVSIRYRHAHLGVALAAAMDCAMDVWGCWMMANQIEYFRYHWVWAGIYYVEWTVLGICVLRLVESRHRFYWFPPLLIYYVFTDSKLYRSRIDDNFAGTQSESLHELAYCSPTFYILYVILTFLDLLITGDHALDACLVLLSTLAVVWITIRIFNLSPQTAARPMLEETAPSAPGQMPDISGIEERVRNWEARPDKPWCMESVSLGQVADDLRVSPRMLSFYINSVLMINFNTWINGLRVEEIKRMIRESPDVDLLDLMVGSGFQSRASISRAVKQATGLTVSKLKDMERRCLQEKCRP